ncbi:MAG: MarR family winged helix-turn-helix transcriptional regulator, partial [Spirosomataceae bacterium]
EKGWIYRQTDKEDKRYVNVFLTEEGKKKRNFARAGVIEFNNRIQEAISAEKMAIFYEVIQQIKDTVEKQTADTKAIINQLAIPVEEVDDLDLTP